MADDSFTPRTLIQGLVKTNPDQLDQTVRVTRRQAHALNVSRTQGSATRPSRKRSASESASSTKKSSRARMSTSMAEATPRTLITGFLSQQDSEKTVRIERRVTRSSPTQSPSRRRSRRASLLKEATTRRMRRSVSGVEEPTPRTMIRGILQDGPDQTPVVALRRLREKSFHQSYVSSDIEVSPEKVQLEAHKSVNEDSFMDAYLQQGSQPTTRQRKEHTVRSAVSVDDFASGVNDKLSQTNRSRLATSSQLENISEEGEGRLSSSPGRVIGTIRVSALVHHDPMSSDKDSQDEDEPDEGRPKRDRGLNRSTTSATSQSPASSPSRDQSRRRTSGRIRAGSPRVQDSRNESGRSPGRFHRMTEAPNDRLSAEEEPQDETFGVERRAKAPSRGGIISAVQSDGETKFGQEKEEGRRKQKEERKSQGKGRRSLVEEERESQEEEESQDKESQEGEGSQDRESQEEKGESQGTESQEEEQRRPGREERTDIDEEEGQAHHEEEVGAEEEEEEREEETEEGAPEVEAELSSHGVIPGSESDDTDSPEGLPGFNQTFTSNATANTTRGSLRQTTLDGYSTIQTPVLPPTQTRSRLETPDVPAASQHIRPSPAKQTPVRGKAAQARQPLSRISQNKKPPKKKTVLPRLPKVNTTSIFKHFTSERVSKEALAEIESVADLFWKNLAGDLEVYADHAGRMTVDESDVRLLMDRQHVTSEHQSMYALVEKYLPLEYQQEIIDVVRSGNQIIP